MTDQINAPSKPLLDPPAFKSWVNGLVARFGKDLAKLVLPNDMEVLIVRCLMEGSMEESYVTYDLVKGLKGNSGHKRMRLADTPVMFTDGLSLGRGLIVLNGGKV